MYLYTQMDEFVTMSVFEPCYHNGALALLIYDLSNNFTCNVEFHYCGKLRLHAININNIRIFSETSEIKTYS